MPAKPKFYGVRCGREGPKVYQTWANCAQNTSGYSGALYKGFNTKEEAQSWVDTAPKLQMAPYDFTSDHRDSSPLKALSSTADEARTERSISPIDEFSPTKPFKIPTTSFKTEAPYLPPPLPVLTPADVILSPEQDAILKRVNHGESLFFTGSAGTGKSVLLREIIKSLGRLGQKPAVTASTGIAAVNIGGATLHSWAGIGLGKEKIDILIAKIRSGKETRKRWTSTNTLIIDEISMIDGVLFDKLDAIGRALRHDRRPFGGIQVVSGDFLQLPPVPDQLGGIPVPITFAFESDAWNQALGKPYILTQVFRQKETDFIDILTRMRYGELDIASSNRLRSLSRELFYSDGIGPTELYPRRDQVEKANKSRLELIPESLHCFQSRDIPGSDSYGRPLAPLHAQKVLDRLVAVAYLELKVGAQVMLIKNLIQGHLVNGSVGKVISFETPREAVDLQHEIGVVDQEKDPVTVTRRVFSDQSNDNRQQPLPVDEANKSWPLISFPNGRKLLIMPEEFEVMNARGLVEATRRQVPLILAWALSVHKSQGLTLDRVKVNLASTFEKGQAYVALSRATSLKRLEVMGFDPSKVKAHPTVIAWEKTASISSRPVVAEEDFDAYFDEWDDDELAALAMEQYHESSPSK